jgi:osmotically-inducible protein OsmY
MHVLTKKSLSVHDLSYFAKHTTYSLRPCCTWWCRRRRSNGSDRRTSGIYVEDQAIELKAGKAISDSLKESIHVNVTSYNRQVVLTGEVSNEANKKKAESLVKPIENVASIKNYLEISPNSSMSSRTNDAYITSKVKANFIKENKFAANYVKVVTENGAVYLLGLVTHKEADDAVEIARAIGGVKTVVKIFEYID